MEVSAEIALGVATASIGGIGWLYSRFGERDARAAAHEARMAVLEQQFTTMLASQSRIEAAVSALADAQARRDAEIYARITALETTRVHSDDHDSLVAIVQTVRTDGEVMKNQLKAISHTANSVQSMLIGLLTASGGGATANLLKSLMPQQDDLR